MKIPSNSLKFLAAASVCALLASTGHAALVLNYEYNGTNPLGVPTPNPTVDSAAADGTGRPNDPGALPASGVTYQTGNSPNTKVGSGTSHIQFSSASGPINFTDDVGTGTTQDMLNGAPGATLFTDFRLDVDITTGTPRFIFLSTNDSTSAGRAEIKINNQITTVGANFGKYVFTLGGRSRNSAGGASDSFQFVDSSAQTLTIGTWYSLAGVIDYTNKTLNIYLNGTNIGSKTTGVVFGSNTVAGGDSQAALIGSNTGGTVYTGDLDNTRIYNEALSASAIAALSIPEPTTGVMLLGGLGALILARRRSRR